MHKTITWRGLEDNTVENCTINRQPDRVTVSSEIAGANLAVQYKIETNETWLTNYCEIKGHVSEFEFHYQFKRGGNGIWTVNGMEDIRFDKCDFVDISLTPFTNTLPINRLGLSKNETAEIRVVYFDFSEMVVRPVAQRYTRLSANVYHYENVPNDFEADIEVDDHGFVVHYPSLFIVKAP